MKLSHKRVFLVCTIFAAVLWGALRIVFLSEADLKELIANLHNFAVNFDYINIGVTDIGASLFRHGHLLVLVWFCASLPKLSWAAYPLLYLRTMTVTFSFTLMIQAFGWQGLLISLVLNIPQHLLILSMAGYTIYKISAQNKYRIALLCSLSILFASLYEVLLAPLLFRLII